MRNTALISCLTILLGSCAGPTDSTSATIYFGRDGKRLRLESAPLKAAYEAVYPNPRQHEWLRAELRADGRLVVTCRTAGGAVACSDSPIVVRVESVNGLRLVRAYDVYQQRLAELPYAGRCGTGRVLFEESGSEGGTPPPSAPFPEGGELFVRVEDEGDLAEGKDDEESEDEDEDSDDDERGGAAHDLRAGSPKLPSLHCR